MDVAGSFLELSCVRLALIPAGSAITDSRFEELCAYLTTFREIPVSALPRRAAVPRVSGNATFSSMPVALREALAAENQSTTPLHRSRSASRDIGRSFHKGTISPRRNIIAKSVSTRTESTTDEEHPSNLAKSQSSIASQSFVMHRRRQSEPVAWRGNVDLNMAGPDVDASFRLKYDIVHRDHAGTLLMRPFSEWDDFHSSKTWGVIGIVDCSHPNVCNSVEKRKQAIFDAYDDFRASLTNFKDASVRRLIVFTSSDAAHESGPFVLNDPKPPSKDGNAPELHFSVGYVPERTRTEETRLEVRAQIVHFSGLLLNAIDRDTWKRRESPHSDLLISPIDEKYTADRQSKLSKRRPGRLEKVLGDSLLQMGNPSEALTKYNSAIEKAKANSDRLWLAGAMEGWSAAHVLTHVGSGGSVSSPLLSDRLIEHYAEIYKLYQKKRVAEPEAAAALRLAGFLGRWTNRRKDALDAAEHAATVGEGLRDQKRAALWEALARFSDQMGCSRKAALYLYRLGHLNATQSIWSSAVTLMIAAERQLTRDGRKPWSNLNRKILLTAAGHAESAGDSSTAARLFVEALVTPRLDSQSRKDEDESLVRALSRSHVPAFLPAAGDIIRLGEVSALHIDGLSISHRAAPEVEEKMKPSTKDGPFIYNPFEAKKRAKAAAIARRTVTWISGEHAQIAVRLYNKTSAELDVDVIAVLLKKGSPSDNESVEPSSAETAGNGLQRHRKALDDSDIAADHAMRVRLALKRSTRIAETKSECVSLPSQESKSGVLVQLTVIPKRKGPLFVEGLLVRLFNGALVVLESKEFLHHEAPPVNVIGSLPIVSVQSRSTEGGAIESSSGRTPMTVYHGELRRFHVDIENTGTETIKWMRIQVLSSHPEVLQIVGHDFDSDRALRDLEAQGSSKTFTIEVEGKHPGLSDKFDNDAPSMARSQSSFSVVSIVAEYEGHTSPGTVRESSTHVKVASRSALRIRRVDIFTGPRRLAQEHDSELQADCYVAIDVRNDVSAPATVRLIASTNSSSGKSSVSSVTEDVVVSSEEHLVENGASSRFISNLSVKQLDELKNRPADKGNDGPQGRHPYQIQWKLPALGRQGILKVASEILRQVICTNNSSKYEEFGPLRSPAPATDIHIECSIGDSDPKNDRSWSVPRIKVGHFWKAEVTIQNRGTERLSKRSMLDVEVTQMDKNRSLKNKNNVAIVGITEAVLVGPLRPQTGTFSHKLRLRILSTGNFELRACLYDGTKSVRSQGNVTVDGSFQEGQMQTPCGPGRMEITPPQSISPVADAVTDIPVPASPMDIRIANTTSPPGETEVSAACSQETIYASTAETPTASPPRMLRRVGIPKTKKAEDTKTQLVPNILYPKTVDSFPETTVNAEPLTVLARSTLRFSVVVDAGCTSSQTKATGSV